jgi:hypothetical protein
VALVLSRGARSLTFPHPVAAVAELVGGTIGIAVSLDYAHLLTRIVLTFDLSFLLQIASTIFYNRLYSALDEFAPGAPAIVRSSVSAIKDIAPELQPSTSSACACGGRRSLPPLSSSSGVKKAYVAALNNVFIVSSAFSSYLDLS